MKKVFKNKKVGRKIVALMFDMNFIRVYYSSLLFVIFALLGVYSYFILFSLYNTALRSELISENVALKSENTKLEQNISDILEINVVQLADNLNMKKVAERHYYRSRFLGRAD